MLSSLSATNSLCTFCSKSVPSPQILRLNHRNLRASSLLHGYRICCTQLRLQHMHPPGSTHSSPPSFSVLVVQRILSSQSPKPTADSLSLHQLQERWRRLKMSNKPSRTNNQQSGKYLVIFLVVARDLSPEIACLQTIFSLRVYASNDRRITRF